MAVIRRINITEFREVTVDWPIGSYEDFRRVSDFTVLDPQKAEQAYSLGLISSPNGPVRIPISTWGLDDWGFSIPYTNQDGTVTNKQILKTAEDSNNDGIPDYLSIDLTNDGSVDGQDGFGSQDFSGVIKRTFLLGRIRYEDVYDNNLTVTEMYAAVARGQQFNSQFSEPGWVLLAESKPSFYYEQCNDVYGGEIYSGRVPISLNYFDMDDIWVNENGDGSWNLVSEDNPLEIIGRVDLFNPPANRATFTGFDANFGPNLVNLPYFLPMKFIQQYLPFVINEMGQAMFPNMVGAAGLATIRSTVEPVNLHLGTRFDLINNNVNERSFSEKAYNNFLETLSPGSIPDNIPFRDGPRKRWGTPRLAIQRGFTVNGTKFRGNCIPIPGELEGPEIDSPPSGKRTRVSIRDVVSRKVFLDGTNYIRGVVTAHFTFPIMSATQQDISDIYYAYYDDLTKPRAQEIKRDDFFDKILNAVGLVTGAFIGTLQTVAYIATGNIVGLVALYKDGMGLLKAFPKIFQSIYPKEYTNHPSPGDHLISSEFSPKKDKIFHSSDFLTFAREMRSVIYVQDETGGMELMGTDFYSTEGLEFKTSPGQLMVTGGTHDITFEKYKDGGLDGGGNLSKEFDETIRLMREGRAYDYTEAGADLVRTTNELLASAANNVTAKTYPIPIKEYWETDTGYLPSRYHFKVGDFIEVYNLHVFKHLYAPRTCKVVNNEYKIIPNDVEDVNKFFEDNGYIKDVSIEHLFLINERETNSAKQYENTVKWWDYTYEDEYSAHNTEHCLIRIKGAAFLQTYPEYIGGDALDRKNQMFFYRNDNPGIILPSNTTAREWDDFGHRFEPGRKYVICDANGLPSDTENPINRYRIWLYNAPSTEMSTELLKIPGKNINLDGKYYLPWLKKKRQFDPSGSLYRDYKWPLDIIGIQKHSYPTDSTSDWRYMIMPRSMEDLGISQDNYDILRPLAPFPSGSVNTGGGTTGGGTTGGGTGGSSSGGGTKNTCFKIGTKVLTPNGYIPIEEIVVGDLVVTFDNDLNLHEREVIRTYKHDGNEKSDIYIYTFSNGTILNVTENHPFLDTNKKFVNIGDLNIGDSVLDKNGNSVEILSKEYLENDVVYNIEVDEFNAYIAEEICVHNLTKTAPNLNDIIVEGGPDIMG